MSTSRHSSVAAGDDSHAASLRMVEEFQQFVSERVSHMDIVRSRVRTVTEWLRHPAVSVYPLATRVAFLRFKTFSNGEIEAALEEVADHECLAFLEATERGEVLEPKYQLQKHQRRDDGASGSAAAINGATTTASQGNGGHEADTADGLLGGNGDDAYWRVGAMVYAYKGDSSYYLVPFVGIDRSRAEDILMVRHQLPTGEYGPVQYLTAGFKGVVPDEFAPFELVTPGQTVIAEYPGAYRNHMKEAVVASKSTACTPDGNYSVDLEWVHSPEVSKGVDHRTIRLLIHPKRMQAEMLVAAAEQTKKAGTGATYNSTTSFPVFPAKQPMSDLLQSISSAGEAPEYIKNFQKFQHLDRGVQPRTTRTAAQFVAQHGQFYHDQGIKSFPLVAPSQLDHSMTGFGFPLASLERHPLNHRFFVRNPIIDICDQCYKTDSMFVDPDFPPTFYSITGRTDEIPSGVVWRRLSEVFSKPRLFTVGSKALDLVPGKYTPSWFTAVMHALQGVAELEEMISPGEDGWAFGAYAVKLFLNGQWVFTVVDDFVPCDEETGAPLAAVSATAAEIYCTILEKVLAKIVGCYAALPFSPTSTAAHAWEDLSSNATEMVEHRLMLQKESLSENLYALVSSDGSSSNGAKLFGRVKGEERYEDIGFHCGEWWWVDAVVQYIPPGRKSPLYFFHVCRPTNVGQPVPYADSHREKFFRTFPPDAADHFPTRGLREEPSLAYWLSSNDYYAIFDRSYMFWFYNNTQRVLVPATFSGHPDGAQKRFGVARWLANPQIYLSFVQPTDVIIELKLLDRRLPNEDGSERSMPSATGPATLQAHLVRGRPVAEALTEETDYVASSQAVDLNDDEEARFFPSSMIRATLPGGNFVLIPSLQPNATDAFLVKVFSVSACYAKPLN